MVTLVIGPGDIEITGLILETDLGNPLQGLPGMVSLYNYSQCILQYFIGYTSAKHNTKKYLESIQICFHKYLSDFQGHTLLVHCHNWKSGIGRILISDIISLTYPGIILEYYTKISQALEIISESQSFLSGSYPKPKPELHTIQVLDQKICDFKLLRNKLLCNYFKVSGDLSLGLMNIPPRVCFFQELIVKIDGEIVGEKYGPALIGKIVGVSLNEVGNCLGLGVIRDFNRENGMIYLVTPICDLDKVDCLEVYTGDGSLVLDKNDLWHESLVESFEFEVPNVLQGVVLSEKANKYHPSRNIGK
ncbi:hypothetical protein SteCoe_3460 [Stentor coeruleus]|uniref:Clp1 P-loop domain-containing protein n=1 Tax=Stentor coeruleus TaxID=5963 RepID=A0A1R2CWU7_9CILI|nr:hypothetical protein SteCoe_3460 [Stentor coeruleus]